MEQIRLKDIYLGENDGKKEAVYRSDFEKFFVDIDKNYEKIQDKRNFLVLGRKGSGKTFFGQYIKKMAESDPLQFCDISSYKDFKFQELVHLKSGDIQPNEYYEIWRWLLLLDLAKLCLTDQGIPESDAKEKRLFDVGCGIRPLSWARI
ncbi:P-loop ATPase, Sll1717 family [Vreelandella stevensii]|uniref:P-loop ATPase, Sll1717 family n=1 Tax=Vreelandella stevensii TaxID=502821 RepID=UPI0037480257